MSQWRIIAQYLKQKTLSNRFSINSEPTLADNLKDLYIFVLLRANEPSPVFMPAKLLLEVKKKNPLIKTTNSHNSNKTTANVRPS